ncbi:MAG: P-II family nitrogen regulator [Dehalococcoidales bacterium]|nr:P-II family nitrogen regulator [Dehalococcoidales bacterium]
MESGIYLIVTVVNKGWGEKVLETSMKAGATGGTIVLGRGMGIHEQRTLLGISLEPEKEIVLSAVRSDEREAILKEIVAATELEKPGAGIAFTLPIDKIFGISHHFPKDTGDEFTESKNAQKSSETENPAMELAQSDDVKTDTAPDKKE